MIDVIVVAKRTAYAQNVLEKRDPQAMMLLKAGDPTVARWLEAHDDHERTLAKVLDMLTRRSLSHSVVPARTAFDASSVRLVMTVGGDGTLLAASHHVGACPILGVNSSPLHSTGFFCAATVTTVEQMLDDALQGTVSQVRLSRMQVQAGERMCSMRVLNEALFCHSIPAATSRYILDFEGKHEEQRSSGIWVGTAAGSTAAIRSAGGDVLPLSSAQLQMVVREPYLANDLQYHMQKLIIEPGQVIAVRSKMQDARLFLDGPFASFDVGLGEVVQFRVSDEPLTLLGK